MSKQQEFKFWDRNFISAMTTCVIVCGLILGGGKALSAPEGKGVPADTVKAVAAKGNQTAGGSYTIYNADNSVFVNCITPVDLPAHVQNLKVKANAEVKSDSPLCKKLGRRSWRQIHRGASNNTHHH